MQYWLPIIIIAAIGAFLKAGVRRITILEYEKGLKYERGRFESVLGPGQYWYTPFFTIIQKLDVRPRFVTLTGQEVLSSDGVTLKTGGKEQCPDTFGGWPRRSFGYHH